MSWIRSSPAMERELRTWMQRTGQTFECGFNHGLATATDYAMPLFAGPCIQCGSEL